MNNPKVIYLAMHDQIYTFNMFDSQAWYARDVIMGKIKLPGSVEEMKKLDAPWVEREKTLVDMPLQTKY